MHLFTDRWIIDVNAYSTFGIDAFVHSKYISTHLFRAADQAAKLGRMQEQA